MLLFGQRTARRHRTSRLAIGAQHGTFARVIKALRNRSILARLLVCTVGIAILLVVVEAWKSPFPHRIGTHALHGLLASVDFSRVNELETLQRRNQASDRVPLHFRRLSLPSDSLTDQLRADFQAILDASSPDDLPTDVHDAFLSIDNPSAVSTGPNPSVRVSRFEQLRSILLALDQPVDERNGQARIERAEGLLAEFQQLLRLLDQSGVIDPSDLERLEIRPGRRLAIQLPGSRVTTLTGPGSVNLPQMIKPGGTIASLWESIPLLARIRPQIESWLSVRIEPTLSYDRETTEQARETAREKVDLVYEKWYAGQVLVGQGELIGAEEQALLLDEYRAADEQSSVGLRLVRMGTVFLMLIVLSVINGNYVVRNEPALAQSWGGLIVYLLSIILAVGLGRWAASFPVLRLEVVPVVVTAMIFAVAYNQVMAALTAMSVSLILTLSTFGDLSQFVVLMSVAATAVILLTHVPSRATLIKVGFVTGVVYMVVFSGMHVLRSSSSFELIWGDAQPIREAFKGAAWCLGAGFLVAGSLPAIERSFGVVTDISLLEMSDISHPLLQELVRRAPGTYNHSISVATIGEAAAEAIGANGLLVRVGAYFHDIGKMLKPGYFIENIGEGEKSRHEDLAPAMSTLIIIGHVKDGVDLALEHHLPQKLIDFIEQHHGTTLVQFFYHEALKQAEAEPDHKTDAEESSFRYPGPKPQTREAGVMLLADAVESASRTLSEPTPKRIESLVHKITMDKLLDGQFEESKLTLSEIRTVEETLKQSLIAIHHGRIKYPEQRSAG